MATDVNILEDASAMRTEQEGRSNECAPAGSAVNQTVTKISENENEHKKPAEIKDAETGSDKIEVINDFNVEEQDHDRAHEAMKISKLSCAEETKDKIHEAETSTDISSFDQHFEVITNEHANLEVISESVEKEIITSDKDEISRSTEEKDSNLDECREQATSILEVNLGAKNEALLPNLDLETKNQGEDDVRVVDSCIKDEDIGNRCSNNSIHVEVKGKDIESFRSNNKLESELEHDKTEDASINVAETPYIHHGEEATPEAASNNEDDNNNKLENQPSDLATEGVSTLGVALEAGESLNETSCAEIKKDILDSKWQVIDVPPVDEINKAEDSALLNSNGGGENGEDISQIGLTEINEDRKINPERDDGDQRGSWQQNEQQEKLGGDFILIPEKSEISAAGENVEMSTGRLHSGEKFEEKEEKEEPASTPNGEEALLSTEKNLPLVESITESEVKTEPQEENQESSKPHADIEEETEFQSEAQSKDIVSNDNNSEGAATKEIILQSNQAIEEHGNVLESLHSDEKIEIKNGGKIIPDKAKERKEVTDIQTQKTSTESISEDEASIRDRTIEQSFQEESPRESGPALIDDEHHRPENEETINILPVNEKKSQNLREGTSVEVEEENNVSNLPPEFSETVNELERDSTVAVPKHVEVVTSMNNENAVPEEMELAERTEESSEAVVEREGEEETTATLEGISQKENIEEKVKATDDTKENEAENQEVQVVEITVQVVEITESNQATTETVLEVGERPKTDASESKTEDKEIDNTVESGTLPSEPMGIEKGENASCETKIEEEVEATITNASDDSSVNNSEAASLEDVNEPALKEVKSLNEEQPEASDASPDMKDFTNIKTTANGLGSVELDEREEQETNTEAKRDVEVLEVADEGGQQISHDITDQALTTSKPLSEVQLDQTFVDSDMVPSKEDPQTIEVSKPTDNTVAGDDASYVQAETPFIAHFEVSTGNKKENADEETDQKNTVEYQPITQRDKEQVIVLADHSEINKLETAEDEKSTVEVSKHIEVDTSANSENVVLEGEVLAERTEDSSAVFTVERVGQEETTATLEGISQKENVEDKLKAMYDTKENEAANQEKQEESVLGEFKDDDADGDKDAKIELIHEEYSMKTLHNDEKEKVEEFADVTTEGSKADASGENLESTEFTAEEETTTTHEEISQKEEKEEKIKPIDDDTKDNESENQEEQVFVTTEESQATAENILEVCEKSEIDASESKLEDRETENTVGSGTLSSVSVDTQKGREFPEENESGDKRIKEEVEETSLAETKVTDTSDDFSEPKEDNDPLTTEENNNKLAEISTSTLGVSEKYEYGTNDSETAVLGDVSEKPATKEDRSINEEKPEISDASPDMTDLTTIETIANSLSSVNIDEVKEKETDTEEKRDMEVPVIGDEDGEQISHDITDQALTTGTPLLQVQLEQTFVDSDIVLSKDDPETIETSKTTDKTIAGDDVSYIDADTAFIAHVKGSSDNKKDNADEEIDEKNTVEDQPLEQKEREQVIVFADQNEANELEIDKDEKSTVEVSKHVEVVSSMNSESAVLEEEELAERTEDSSAVVVVEREGQEETTATIERISQKENIEEKVTATDDTKENEAASQEVEVTKAESEDQTEATNLMDRNISNTSDDIPEPKEDHGASTIEQNNHNLVENSSSISEVFEKDDNSTNGSESETVRVVSENTAIEEGNTEYEEQLKGSDAAAPAKKDVTTIETKSISSSIFNNDERQEEESLSENVPEVVEEVISHEARKLEVCEDKKPTVEVSKYTEVSTGVNNESALLEEEELSGRTDESPAPAVIGEENEAAEPKAGSPSSEEEPAITKNSELLIEKSLHSDESERSELVEDKDKEAMIKLKDNFTNVNDGEEKVEDFPDMNCEGSKEETKITVEKISQIEEIEEKEVRFINDTKETEAANQEIPVTDTAGLAPGENNSKVCETSTTEALVSKPQEEIENIIGTLPSALVGTEAGNEYPHVHTDDTRLQQEVEVTYVESTEQIEATSLIERKTSNPLDNYLEPKEDHGSLTTEENNNNLVDNASPTAGVLEKNESNITDSETEFLGITSDKTTMKGNNLVHEDQSECSDAVTQTRNVTCSNVSDERQEEETNSEENRNMEVLEASDEGLVSHDIEEKFEITGTDHEKESTISKPQSDEQLAPTDMNSSMVPSKEEPETIESSKTTKDTPARDDKQERTDGGDQKDKDQHDHMSPYLKTKNDISDTEDMEQLKREQVSGLEDQNGAYEVEIVKDEKSFGEVLKLIEDATSIKGEETVLEEGEHTERTEDGPAASGVEEKPADLKEGSPISEEDAAPDMKDITASETKADCSSSVNNDERQEEESNLEENQNINVPEVVEEGINRETDLTIGTPPSDDQLVHTFIDSSKNDRVPIENSDEGVYQKHKVVDETLLHELKTVDNISGTDATEQQEKEQVAAVSSDQNEAFKLEFCKDETPTVEVSKHIEASTSRNDDNTLLEEEDLAERTDKGPEVIGVEDEAAEQQAGSPGSEEPAITKSSELLNEKSLSSDEPDRSGLAEDKEKDAEINLKREEYSQQMPQKNGEEKVEEFADMNYDSSKADATTEYSERTTYTSEEETKITVEKISQEEETEEKVRSIDDTKETEAAKHEIPVTDGASHATGENNLKVSETLNTDASISKPQEEEIENIVGTFSSVSVGIQAEKEHPQAHADETKLKQEVEVKYAESTEKIEATLDNSSEPKEDHDALTMEENNNNLVDNDSPTTGVFEKVESNINDSETQFLGVTGDKTIMKDDKPVNEDQLEGSDVATQTKDVTTTEREEEEINSEANKSNEVPEVADEGLQQESRQIEEKAKNPSLDHKKESTISTPQSDEQLVQTNVESSIVPSKEQPETSKTAEDTPERDEEKEGEDGRDQKHKDQEKHMPLDLKTENDILDTDDKELLKREQVSGLEDPNEASELESVKDEMSSVEVSKDIEVVTCITSKNVVLEEEETVARTEVNSAVAGAEREAAELKERTPSSEEEPARTKSRELLVEEIYVTDGASQVTGENNLKVSDTSNTEASGKEYPQVHTDETKLPQKVEVTYAESSKEQIEATSLPERKFSSTLDNISELKEDHGDLTTEENNSNLFDNASPTARVFEKDESNITDSETEFLSIMSDKTILKDDKPVNEDGSDAATQTKDVTTVETKNSSCISDERQEEETNSEEIKSMEVPEVADEGSQQVSHHIEDKAEITGVDHEKEYTAHTPQLDSNMVPSNDGPETIESSKTTEKSAVEVSKDIEVVTSTNDKNIVVEEEGHAKRPEGNSAVAGVEREAAELKEGTPISEEEPAKTKSSELQVEKVEVAHEENEAAFLTERKISKTLDELSEPKKDHFALITEENNADLVDNSTSGVSEKDESNTNESSMVLSKEEAETIESSKATEDTPARDEEKEREDGRDQKHKDQDELVPSDLKTENDILDREDIEQLKREQVSGLEDQNESSELEIVKDGKASVEVSKDIEVVTCIDSKNIPEEEEIAARTEDNSAVIGVEREVAEVKEGTPSSEEERAESKTSELLAEKIDVIDGASQVTGENLKASETSNIEASVSKPQEQEIENIVVTSPSASVGIEAGKEYPQVHTDETKLPQKVEVTYAESSKEQIEATSLTERKFSSTSDNISELKEDHGDLTTEENNNNLVDNASPTAEVFEKDKSNITDSETEFLSITSDKIILKDDKPVNEDQLEGSDAATQTKDVTTIETRNSSCMCDERQEEETNLEENKSMEVPEVADEGLQQASHHIEDKAEITGLDHEKESTTSTPQLDEQLVQTQTDSNLVPSKDGHETIESIKTTEKSTVEMSKDIEVVTSTNDKTIVVEEEELAKRTEGNSTVAGVEREVAEQKEGTPSSEEEPAKTKSSELQVEKVEVAYEELKEQNEATFLIERKISDTLDELPEPKEDHFALTTEENNVDLVDNSTSAGVSEKDENNTNESSTVPSKEEAETIESSKATEDTPTRDDEKEREDGRDQKHKDQDGHMPSDLKTENDILDRGDIEQLKREQVSGLEDQNESGELEIVKDEMPSVEVSKDIEVATCINSNNVVLEEEEIAARTEDSSAVTGVEREVAEVKEGTPSSEEEPTESKTGELQAEKVEITYEDNKPVNEDQVEVCDAATNLKNVTNIETEANSSIVSNDERQEEETNSEENRNTEVLEAKDDGGQKMSHEIKQKDVITCTDHEKESTISTALLDEQLVQTYADSSMVPSKEDHELIGSSKTTEEFAARDEESTSFEISEGASTLANSDNEKEKAEGGDQKHKDQDQLVCPHQKSQNDISDAEDIKQWKTEQVSGLVDQNETRELEIVKDEKSVEVLKQIEDIKCIKGEETVLKEEQHTERNEDSPAVIRVEEEPAELKGGSPINEEEPTITKNSELLLEKIHHTVETTDNGSIKEEVTKQSIIAAEEEGIEVEVLDSELKQHTKATELTEEKESVTLEDHTKQNINIIDISSLTSTDVLETGNKDSSSTSRVYERETAAEVLKKDEPIVDDDAKHVSVTVVIEETGLKNVVPEHEEQYKGSDFATEKESVTTILTQTTILNDKDIHERQEENFSMEKKGILEEADESHLKTDIHHVEETDKSTSVQNEGEGTTSSVLNFEDYPQQSLEEKDNYAPEITDKAEETHVPEHTTENKLLHKELEVAKQEGVYEVETEKSNGSENILEQTPEPESNATETDAVSALDNTLTEVTARNSESIKQIENLKNFANANADVSSLTTIEALEEETCGEESKQTLSRDSENEKQKADGEYQKDKDQDELMPPDLKSANVIWGTEDIEQWKREQVSGLADQIEVCELEPVKVEMSTVEVPKDAEVVTSMNGKDMLEEQDLAERAEENLAVVGVEREVAELKEGSLSCEDEPVKTKSSELLTEKVEVTYEESKKQKGALDDLPEPKEDHGALTTKEKNDNLVDNSSPSVEVLEKDENSTNDSDSATIEDDKPINKDQVEVSDAATETKDVTTIETEAHSSSVDNDERQEEATANSKEDQGSIGSSQTTEETAARDDSSDVDTKTASFEITEGDSILENSDNEKEIADGGDQKRKDQDQHMSPDPKSENDILDTEQLKTQHVSGLADQNETRELEIVGDEKSVDEVSKHIEDGTCIKGEETVLEKDKHIGRTEDSPAVIGVEGESSELKEGSPISEEEPTNTKNSELLVEKVHHMVETADNGNIKEEFMERSITSSEEEGGIEVRVSKSELKQHIEATELTEEKESLALEDHREASETCIVESSSITKVYEREAEAEVLKKDEPTTGDDTKDASMTVAIEETGSKDVAPELEEQDKGSDLATKNESVTTIKTESAVLNDKDIHERQEEDSSTEKMGIPEEDDCRLKTDYCVEETEKTSTMQHEREVTTSSVLDSQDYPQQSLEEKGIYVTEEITDKAAETYFTEHTTENKLLLHEREVAKQEGVFEVETEKSNASENILEQTTERESKVTESDVVSSADKIVNEVTATNSESIKQIESLENFSKVNEDVGSFNTAEASQEETHQEESKKTLFRTSSLESREAMKDTKGEIIKKDDASNISETLPRTLVGEDTGLNETLGENNKQENNFPPATEARDVTSTDTVNSRLDTINTDAIQEKSSCSEKNGEKQSPEIADEAVQEMHEDIRDKAPPKTVEHEEDSSFTTVPHDNLQCSLVTQAEEGSSANAESPFVVHTMEEKLTESNPDVIKEQIVDSEVRLMELQISSTRDEVEDSNLSSTETLKVEGSNKQTVIVESSIKEDHPTTKGAESAIKALQEDIQNESSRRPTEVPIVALQVVEQKMEKNIEVEEDNCPIMTNTPPVEVLRVESGPKEAQLDKALKRSDLDDQCPETIKSLQAEEVIGVKDETASSSLIAQLPPKVHENVDACEQNLAAENTDVGQGEDFLRTYEIVSKDEIIDDELLQTGADEKLQNQTSLSLERKQEQGIQITSQNTEENSKAVETLDHNFSDLKTAEETCLEKEDSIKFIDHNSGTKIYEDSQMDSSSKSHQKGKAPEEASNLKTIEKAFEYVQEVHSDKAVIELEDREYPIKRPITEMQPEENQSEKTIAAEKTTNTKVLDEKINEEKEGGKFFPQDFLSKTHQENEREEVDPFKKTKETFQTLNNDNKHEVKSEALEVIQDKLPCDVEGKNIAEGSLGKADVESDHQQNRKTNENVLEVSQSPNEETTLEVSPENAEPGRAIGIGIILEGEKVGEEKIRHLGGVLTKKSTSIDAEKTSNISEKTIEEPLEAPKHLDEATDKAVSTEKEKTQEEEIPHVKDDKIEVISGATEIVESSKDVDIKVAHKKHHNILSGVGSKVKHSISKVKKAITCKSSHSKSSPK